ncbi:AMP-binding protein [Zestomonas carbonaria]|uniref:2-succinylbenzoate--CoA ligase n=1 Tax=Zestomonas carbonaria TaxID=2762745 RepID=A0A7U7EJ82_9GAMM|nr:AMP-binding protein [Pseudomonas carbonaria]CAD5105871.1 2-succinylbenzoate--CoA ligase [Pseudomonas carbonaria]
MPRLSRKTPASPRDDGVAEKLLDIVRQTVIELRPYAAEGLKVGLHSDLDRDLGLDSLARVELWARLEQAFGVRFPEDLFSRAETPQDLLHALREQGCLAPLPSPRSAVPESAPAAPSTPAVAGTLMDVLDWHLHNQPERIHVRLLDEHEHCDDLSYAALHQGSLGVACGLQRRGLRAGQAVALMLPTGRDFLFAFVGTLLAGGVPVPIYPPMRLSQVEEHLRRQAAILANAEAVALITVAEAKLLARLLKPQVPSLREVASVAELADSGGEFTPVRRKAEDIAFLQYTSGSTGQPKGVMVSHANLLANLRAMGEGVRVSSRDVFVSWLPMYHDMGLIGAWLGSLYYAYTLVLMSPLSFLARPARWLWAIHHYGGTLSAAPNFAYELCLSRIADSDIEGLDLSHWRLALNGAEPVNPDTLRRFVARFSRYGLPASAPTPVYGLAEGTLGVAFPPLERGPLIDLVQREAFQTRGLALPAEEGSADTLRFVSCGRSLPGHRIRIVDDNGRELPERREGHLQFSGPSTSRGYFHNPEETRRVQRGEWMDSLDLGYLADGELYLTGRAKDLIIRAGRNIYPYDVETAVGNVPGLRKGCVAVFGSRVADSGTERLVVLAETHEHDAGVRQRLQQEINRIVVELAGVPPDDIVLAPPHSVLKTSSGKIRRSACRELYESGELVGGRQAVWRQLLRLGLRGAWAQVASAWRSVRAALYGGYIWLLFWLMAPLTWLGAALLPWQGPCRAFVHGAARLFVRLAGVSPHVEGLERMAACGQCVLAANHASYVDGVILCAALPPRFAFVAKRELAGQWIAGLFLRRIGARFVERFELQRSAEDAAALANALADGESLLFFPEGTFGAEPGLRAFRMGAFVLAARSDLPLLPVAIRGTRTLLPDGCWFPRHAGIEIDIGTSLWARGDGWLEAIGLRDETRAWLLERLDEPDGLGR